MPTKVKSFIKFGIKIFLFDAENIDDIIDPKTNKHIMIKVTMNNDNTITNLRVNKYATITKIKDELRKIVTYDFTDIIFL